MTRTDGAVGFMTLYCAAVLQAEGGSKLLQDLLVDGAAAFFGAFAAVFLTALSGIVKRFYDRRRLGDKAIIELEYVTNRHLQAHSANAYAVAAVRRSIAESAKDSAIPYLMNRLQAVPFSEDQLKGLVHIDLINELFEYQEELRKFNADVEMLNQQQDTMLQFLSARNISPENYLRNLNEYAMTLRDMDVFITHLLASTKRLSAVSRVLARRSGPFMDRIMMKMVKKRYRKKYEAEVQRELGQLESEIAASMKAGQERIRAMFS
jgi:hypothetical protein